jgi:hypothetical protein
MELTTTATSYSGDGSTVSMSGAEKKEASQAVKTAVIGKSAFPVNSDGRPDFKKMTTAQKVAFARERIKSDLVKGSGNAR